MGRSDETKVLTFTLGDETYCLDIDYVAEIVDGEELTRVPDTASHVEGVMDLRGRTTRIVDPRGVLGDAEAGPTTLATDGGRTRRRIVVLDETALDGASRTGLLVTDVEEVVDVTDDRVDTAGFDDAALVRGLVTADDGFTVWLDPHEMAV